MRIFLSGVSSEFKQCREALASDLRAIGCDVRVQEDFQQGGATLLAQIERYITECERVIAMVGDHYGTEAPAPGTPPRSYAQWEYYFALGDRLDGRQVGAKELFVYLPSADFVRRGEPDAGAAHSARQRDFVAQVRQSGKHWGEFSNIDQLCRRVLRDGWQMLDRPARTITSPIAEGYAERIRAFRAEYVGTPAHPAPFGGRDVELAALDHWLDTPGEPSFAFLSGHAGAGKSALLAHWSQAIEQRNVVDVVYLPISLRFRTNLSIVLFGILAERLTRLGRLSNPDLATVPAEWLRAVALDAFRHLPVGERPLLVIVDGLDESADWEPAADLFPSTLDRRIRIIVSARSSQGDGSVSRWLNQLGWTVAGQVRLIEVGRLDDLEVEHVLDTVPLRALSPETKRRLLSEVVRLTHGDPLLIRLYADDAQQSIATIDAQIDTWASRQPGLGAYLAYFERWWTEENDLWRARVGASSLLHQSEVRTVLSALACTVGPIRREELLDLLQETTSFDSWTLDEIRARLARLVVGDGAHQGYVFQHPRLAEWFRDVRLTARERKEWDGRFARWCLSRLDALGSTDGDARLSLPLYVRQYCGAHLERAEASLVDMRRLLAPEWLSAWLAHKGEVSGYLNDVDRVRRHAATANAAAIRRGRVAGALAVEIQCALASATVNAKWRSLPAALILALVDAGMWLAEHALAVGRDLQSDIGRSRVLSRLSSVADVGGNVDELLNEAVRALEGCAEREALPATNEAIWLAQRLQGDDRREAVRVARRCATLIDSDTVRAQMLVHLAKWLPTEGLDDVLTESLDTLTRSRDCHTLCELLNTYPDDRDLQGRTIVAIADQRRGLEQLKWWSRIEAVVPPPAFDAALAQNIETALQELADKPYFREGVSLVLRRLPTQDRDVLALRLLDAATNTMQRVELGVLTDQAPSSLLRDSDPIGTLSHADVGALTVRADVDDHSRLKLLMAVVERERFAAIVRAWPQFQRSFIAQLVQEAGRLLREHPHDVQLADTLALRSHLPAESYEELLRVWLEGAQQYAGEWATRDVQGRLRRAMVPIADAHRIRLGGTPVRRVAPIPPSPPSEQELADLASAIHDALEADATVAAASTLIVHYQHLTAVQRDRADESIRQAIAAASERDTAKLLRDYVDVFTHPRRQQVFDEARAFTQRIVDGEIRAEHLEGLTRYVGVREAKILRATAAEARHPGWAQQALDEAAATADPETRARGMIDLYRAFPPDERTAPLQRIRAAIASTPKIKQPDLLMSLCRVVEDHATLVDVSRATAAAVGQVDDCAHRAELYVHLARYDDGFLVKAREAADQQTLKGLAHEALSPSLRRLAWCGFGDRAIALARSATRPFQRAYLLYLLSHDCGEAMAPALLDESMAAALDDEDGLRTLWMLATLASERWSRSADAARGGLAMLDGVHPLVAAAAAIALSHPFDQDERSAILDPYLDVIESAPDRDTWSRAAHAPRSYLDIDHAGIALYNIVVLCEEGVLGPAFLEMGRCRLDVLRAWRLAKGNLPLPTLYRVWTIEAREVAAMTWHDAVQHLRIDADLLEALGGTAAVAETKQIIAMAHDRPVTAG